VRTWPSPVGTGVSLGYFTPNISVLVIKIGQMDDYVFTILELVSSVDFYLIN
jgi:hypothetical protein